MHTRLAFVLVIALLHSLSQASASRCRVKSGNARATQPRKRLLREVFRQHRALLPPASTGGHRPCWLSDRQRHDVAEELVQASAALAQACRRGLVRARGSTSMTRLLLGLIRLYRLTLSPWLGRSCRSSELFRAIPRPASRPRVSMKGVGLGLRRAGGCHPFHVGAILYDPHAVSALTG